jgi:protein-disulfide isomerase
MEEEKNYIDKKGKKDYFLPISIVIAGIVIALALVYSSGKGDMVKNNGDDVFESGEISTSLDDHILGSKDATITIFEFSDYECYYCAIFSNEIKPLLVEEYVDSGVVNFVLKDMVYHENSPLLSNMSWCAGEQGKYWEVSDYIFSVKGQEKTPIKEDILEFSKEFGLDEVMLASCIDNGNYINDIIETTSLYQKMGIGATPILVITNQDKVVIDSQSFVSELQQKKSIIQLEGGVAIIGAQPFSVFKTEIDKLIE